MINYRADIAQEYCRFCGSFDSCYSYVPWSDQHGFVCECCDHSWVQDADGGFARFEDNDLVTDEEKQAMKLNERIVCPVCQAEGLTHTSEDTDDYDWYICAKCATQFAIFYNGKLLVPGDNQAQNSGQAADKSNNYDNSYETSI